MKVPPKWHRQNSAKVPNSAEKMDLKSGGTSWGATLGAGSRGVMRAAAGGKSKFKMTQNSTPSQDSYDIFMTMHFPIFSTLWPESWPINFHEKVAWTMSVMQPTPHCQNTSKQACFQSSLTNESGTKRCNFACISSHIIQDDICHSFSKASWWWHNKK